MHRFVAVVGVLVAGCGSKGDDCEQFVTKTADVLGKSLGAKPSPEEKKQAIEECRKDPAMKSGKSFKCVLGASGAAAIHKCFGLGDDGAGKAKRSEADVMLNKLGKNAKTVYFTEAQFPIGKGGPIPSGVTTCCGPPDNKCKPNPADMTGVWQDLDFQVYEPTLYQFSYESTDGKTATATAISDLDCDGKFATWKLELGAPDGTPTTTLTPPSKGQY